MDLARALVSLACLGALSGCGPAHVGDSTTRSFPKGVIPIDDELMGGPPGPKRHRTDPGRVTRHTVDYVSLPFVRTADDKTTSAATSDKGRIDIRTPNERDDRLFLNAPDDLIGTLVSGDLKLHTLERPPEADDSPCLSGKGTARFRGIRRTSWTEDHLSYVDFTGRLSRPGNAKPLCVFELEASRSLEAKAVVPGLIYAGRGPDDRGQGRERLVLVMPDTIWVAASPHLPGGGVTFDGTFTVVELPVERTAAASVVAQIPEASMETWNAWRTGDQRATPEPAFIPDSPTTTVVVDVTWGHTAPAPTVVVRVTKPASSGAHSKGPQRP
ncbi:MAG: hypothetical protein HOV80_00775 [Polyangiaceae bacterium]|nr:hypothetical protein [Polyangiaceae bacterium]